MEDIAQEMMVEEIRKVAKAASELANSKLNPETIEILIHHKTKISKKNIRLVLNTAAQLDTIYLKKEKVKEVVKKSGFPRGESLK